MNSPWHCCVLVPARNEEALLPRCLRSVVAAIRFLQGSATVDVVIAADSCEDQTLGLARSLLERYGTGIAVEAGSAGWARSLATGEALRRIPTSAARCWLANTDADCIVPVTWLRDQLALAERGVEGLAGTVSVDSWEEHGPEVPGRFAESYRIEADGTHTHVHGANIGVRADAYMDAGGWADLRSGEDHDLWRRLKDRNRRLVSTSRIEVVTSGRRLGRTPDGFAGALAAHNEGG